MNIIEITRLYSSRISITDIEIIIAHVLKKTREFVLTHPEQTITKKQEAIINRDIGKRIQGMPIAYITGHKEFYGLDFIVNKHTLIPRPETEQIVELALDELKVHKVSKVTIVDVGTGSGNIIISIANKIEKYNNQNPSVKFFGIDMSKEALKVARKNAKIHSIDKEIKFLHGSLLDPFLKAEKIIPKKLIILANLPYLSKEIYESAPDDVKKYEPKTALYSPKHGLAHYEKLLKEVCVISGSYKLEAISCILEISPEQKKLLPCLIKSILPKAKVEFQKDLAGKWRVCKIILQ